MRSLHKVWDGVIRWIRDYLRDCAKAEIQPDYDMIGNRHTGLSE